MEIGGYGPDGKDRWVINSNVISFMNECAQYMARLSVWKRFVVWRYTIGSGSLNRYLIGIPGDPNLVYWVYAVAKNWSGLIRSPQYRGARVDTHMKRWEKFLWYPESTLELSVPDLQVFVKDFAADLNRIVLGAPAVKKAFQVIKVASQYPELPHPSNFKPTMVPQKPFNSTTLDLELNFGFFLDPTKENLVMRLTIPKGSHVLYIPSLISAYPWEEEILLPSGCAFHLTKLTEDTLPYYSKDAKFIRQIQQEPFTIGPIFVLDQGSRSQLQRMHLPVMIGTYVPP